jgi:uncharacterized protein (TIGR02217 family)
MFIEERLLDCVTFGTQGGPTFSTRRVPIMSGIVRRNPRRLRPLYKFAVIYKNLEPPEHALVIAAFNTCLGGVHSFRIKDWQDYQAEDELLGIATGAAQTLQLQKTYSFGGQDFVRTIKKPVTGTAIIYANGTPILATVDYTTGEVDFTATIGQTITADFEFDVPVYFDVDELPFSGDDKGQNGLFLTADVPLAEDLDA